MKIRRVLTQVARTLLAIGLLLATSSARAQDQDPFDTSSPEESAPLSRGGIERYIQVLSLDPDQSASLRTLFDAYVADYTKATKKMRSDAKTLSDETAKSKDWNKRAAGAMQITKKYREDRQALGQGFLTDLKAILTPKQEAQWATMERLLRREKCLQLRLVSGQADLVEAVTFARAGKNGAAPIPIPPALATALSEYEDQLDRLLKAEEKVIVTMQQAMDAANTGADPQAADNAVIPAIDIGLQIAALNRRHARAIEPLLEPAEAAKFIAEVNRQSYPMTYRRSYVSKAIGLVSAMTDLTPRQKEALSPMASTYRKELAAVDESWARAIDKVEEGGKNTRFALMMNDGGGPDAPVTKAMTARLSLDSAALDRLLAILTDAQKARLPEDPGWPEYRWWGPNSPREKDEESRP